MWDVSTILAAVEATGILIGILIAIRQLRNLNKTRQTELFMNLYETFRNREFQRHYAEIIFQHKWKNFDDWLEKYGPATNVEAFSSWISVPAYFEGIGVLLSRKMIDLSLVGDMLSTQTLLLWEKIEPITKEYRESIKRPQLWEWFEYLYNKMKKREQQVSQTSR